MSGQDDGSRAAAVRELGEDVVRAAEVEVVKANADRLSIATFRAIGIPADSILEGLGLDTQPDPVRPTLLPTSVCAVPADQLGHHAPGGAAPGRGCAR